MIPVDRNRVPPPSGLADHERSAMSRLELEFSGWRARTGKARRPRIELVATVSLRRQLYKLFHSKCAYCETPLEPLTSGAHIDRFRPTLDATGLDQKVVDAEHYWWLVYDWRNLYLACRRCRRAKRNLFPVRGKRVSIGRFEEALLVRELPMLLDPCTDDPWDSLRFTPQGRAEALDDRGEVTIHALGLNRPDLVKSREDVYRRTAEQVDGFRNRFVSKDALGLPPRNTRDSAPHASVARQVYREARYEHMLRWETAEGTQVLPGVRRLHKKATRKKRTGASRGPASSAATPKRKATRTRKKAKRSRKITSAAERLEAVWLEKIQIENFRSIRECELTFPESDSERQPWLMLIGRNGVGKSSILQAAALASCQPASRKDHVADAGACVNRDTPGSKGRIRAEFTNGDFVELIFQKGRKTFHQEGVCPIAFGSAAYGSTRLPPNKKHKAPDLLGNVHVDNLFDPFVPLADAEKRIANVSEVSSGDFRLLREGLAKLLSLEDDGRITRLKNVLYTHIGASRDPFSDQSDGYRSVVCLATDLMMRLSSSGASMEHAVGTVLLDEIEGHLHPEWKIRIVSMLRDVFPAVRFIATTHDPLCLRGLEDQETVLLRRDPETRAPELRTMAVPAGLRADELLTGSWFDLPTTLDPKTEEDLAEHSRLLRKKKRSANDTARLSDLERALRHRMDSFPSTSLERMVADIAAKEYDREHRELDHEDRLEIRKRIEKKLERVRSSGSGKGGG